MPGREMCRGDRENAPQMLGLEEVVSRSDSFIANLECPLTNSEKPIEKIGICLKREGKLCFYVGKDGCKCCCTCE